jgi:hypothetical protein
MGRLKAGVLEGETMPEKAALITALIMERPLCMDCIVARATATTNDVEASFLRIQHVMELRRADMERCRTCGTIGVVFSLGRPSN